MNEKLKEAQNLVENARNALAKAKTKIVFGATTVNESYQIQHKIIAIREQLAELIGEIENA